MQAPIPPPPIPPSSPSGDDYHTYSSSRFSHFHLPSPDSDQDPVVSSESHHSNPDMVTLPSSPLFASSSCPAQLPTPRTPTHDDNDTTATLNSSIADSQLTPMIVPAKRGCKSHVPSACVNCRKAHLACDVSRPCKRCVAAGKTDTCHDAKHKKRGRPRLHESKRFSSLYGGSVILDTSSSDKVRGMIQTATFTMTTASVHRATSSTPTAISFVHEPIESFREPQHTPRAASASRKKDDDNSIAVSSQSQQALRDPEPPPPTSDEEQQDKTITMFLSMEMCCARASDEVTELWGHHPRDLAHRSLYGLISSHDTDRLGRLHRLLLDNIMDMARHHDRSLGPDARPPPSERTTSPLFYGTDPERLLLTASGSSTFSDTLHFTKQSGEHELYEMVVYLGGGLGADLTRPSTLKHLYIVAEMKKHQYRVKKPHHQNTPSTATGHLPPPASSARLLRFRQTPPAPPVRAQHPRSTTTSLGHTTLRPIAPLLARPGGPLQVRPGTLPGHFAANSQLNTVSLPASKKHQAPKVNVAPVSGSSGGNIGKKDKTTTAATASTTTTTTATGPYYFRRIAAASPNGSAAPPIGRESNNPYSTLAYRFAPSAPPAGSPRGGPPCYTHPTTQYFLQTSSSTLNAAASAAQSSSNAHQAGGAAASTTLPAPQHNHDADNDKAVGKTDSKRKAAEMSIRSLLC